MFDTLTNRLGEVLRGLRNRGRISKEDVDEVLGQVRIALLGADVNTGVVRDVLARMSTQAIGAVNSAALNPGQQIIKIVNDEIVSMLGGETLKIHFASRPPTVFLLAGLQGSGKTTSVAKLAAWFKAQGRQPLLVGTDLQRPAAVEQLKQLGLQIGVPVFSDPKDPVNTAVLGLAEARRLGRDILIIDTAGRLSIDDEMMEQVRQISKNVNPNYTFLVVDAMTGQEAAVVAMAFHESLALDGIIISKLDGDAKGGAALSIKHLVGKPIVFSGTGEKIEAFEQFHPDRMASRILGMGDMLTLIERAEQVYEKEQAEANAAKLLEGEFTLEDFLEQLQQIKKMGSLEGIVGMIPGMPKQVRDTQIPEQQVSRTEAIIRSMTPQERARPEIINGTRRSRIAKGSGTQISDINRLVKQFTEMKRVMKHMSGEKGRHKDSVSEFLSSMEGRRN